jgi:hypothetical protein
MRTLKYQDKYNKTYFFAVGRCSFTFNVHHYKFFSFFIRIGYGEKRRAFYLKWNFS